MTAAKITLTVIVFALLINFVGNDNHPTRLLPFLGGHRPGIYDFAAVALLSIFAWGLWRLGKSSE